jgi:hypothetical protein
VLTAAELAAELRRQLGDGWDRPVPDEPPTNLERLARLRRCLKSLAAIVPA